MAKVGYFLRFKSSQNVCSLYWQFVLHLSGKEAKGSFTMFSWTLQYQPDLVVCCTGTGV